MTLRIKPGFKAGALISLGARIGFGLGFKMRLIHMRWVERARR